MDSIGMQCHGVDWRAYALVGDGRETYDLVMSVEHVDGRWLVSNVGLGGSGVTAASSCAQRTAPLEPGGHTRLGSGLRTR